MSNPAKNRPPAGAPPSRNFRIAIAAVLLVILAVQIALVRLIPTNFGAELDTPEYVKLANNIVEKGTFTFDGVNPTRMRQPLYPLFLASISRIVGPNLHTVEIIQAAITVLTLLLLFLTIREIWDTRTGVIGSILTAPFLIALSFLIMGEALFALFLIGAFYYAFIVCRAGKTLPAVLCGLLSGLATLTRPEAALIPAPIVVTWYLQSRAGGRARMTSKSPVLDEARQLNPRKATHRKFLAVSIAMLLTYGATLLPWAMRNYLSMGEFSPVSSSSGYNLWAITRMDTAPLWKWHDTRIAPWKKQGFMTEFMAIKGDNYYLSSEADAQFITKFWESVRKEPLNYISQNAYKTVILWSVPPGTRDALPWAPFFLIAALYVLQALLLILALIGLLYSRKSPSAFLVGLMAVYFVLIFALAAPPADRLLLFPEVFALVLASAGIIRLWDRYNDQTRRFAA